MTCFSLQTKEEDRRLLREGQAGLERPRRMSSLGRDLPHSALNQEGSSKDPSVSPCVMTGKSFDLDEWQFPYQ